VGEPGYVVTETWMVTCNTYRVYQMDVTITLKNEGTDTANGFVTLELTDVASGKVLDAINVIGNVGPESVATQTLRAVFVVAASDDPQQAVHISALVRDGNVPCKACDATGKVALNAWPLYNGIKDNFKQTQIYETPLSQPLRVDVEGGDA
jgi:hypothetical protein